MIFSVLVLFGVVTIRTSQDYALLHVFLVDVSIFEETRTFCVSLQLLQLFLRLSPTALLQMRLIPLRAWIRSEYNGLLGGHSRGRGSDCAHSWAISRNSHWAFGELVGIDGQSPAKVAVALRRSGAGEVV